MKKEEYEYSLIQVELIKLICEIDQRVEFSARNAGSHHPVVEENRLQLAIKEEQLRALKERREILKKEINRVPGWTGPR